MSRPTQKRTPLTVVSDRKELEHQIRCRAYELYEARGRQHGHDLDDWFRAEKAITGKKARAVGAS